MKRIIISMTGIITCMNLMAQTPVSFYPQENAQDINIDTHLVIVFDKTVKTGSKGIITVTDKTTRKVVDRIDMSIPAGPTEGQPKNPNAVYTPVPYIYKVENVTNRNTRPGTPSGAAKEDKRKYQKTIIGGFSDAFHFYPVICHGNKATIYLHNNMLEYGHEYEIKISKGQAEGFLLNGERNYAENVHVIGDGDALQVNGSAYWLNCVIDGGGDTVLGRGPSYFNHCTLTSYGAFMWIRNTRENHGNIFNDCTFKGLGKDAVIARLPDNKGRNYPDAECVLLNCPSA